MNEPFDPTDVSVVSKNLESIADCSAAISASLFFICCCRALRAGILAAEASDSCMVFWIRACFLLTSLLSRTISQLGSRPMSILPTTGTCWPQKMRVRSSSFIMLSSRLPIGLAPKIVSSVMYPVLYTIVSRFLHAKSRKGLRGGLRPRPRRQNTPEAAFVL